MIRLARAAIRANLDAQFATPVNLLAGAFGMILNNTLMLAGLWMMLFAGKPQHNAMLPYFLSIQGVMALGWGLVNFFFGGFRQLATLIEEGQLEPLLATPRSPLLLAGLSRSDVSAFGDIVQGFLVIAFVGWIAPLDYVLRSLLVALIAALGWIGLFTLAGATAFFFARGSSIAQFLIEMTLGLSVYPTGKMLGPDIRWILYFTPAVAIGVLPMEYVERAGISDFLFAIAAVGVLVAGAAGLFKLGLRRYQTVSYVGPRS